MGTSSEVCTCVANISWLTGAYDHVDKLQSKSVYFLCFFPCQNTGYLPFFLPKILASTIFLNKTGLKKAYFIGNQNIREEHYSDQCFFYQRNIARWWIFFSKMLILAKKIQKLIFLSPKFSSNLIIFIRFDHFSSIWENFHQIMMIPSKIWTKVLHYLFHWCHTLDKGKFTEKTLILTPQYFTKHIWK
jgi:hypothetical protein